MSFLEFFRWWWVDVVPVVVEDQFAVLVDVIQGGQSGAWLAGLSVDHQDRQGRQVVILAVTHHRVQKPGHELGSRRCVAERPGEGAVGRGLPVVGHADEHQPYLHGSAVYRRVFLEEFHDHVVLGGCASLRVVLSSIGFRIWSRGHSWVPSSPICLSYDWRTIPIT